jgi:diguanylate cyclase (GGDEF)-like protein
VVLADLDRFKSINDTYGHEAGDAVLHEAARRMKASLRPYDHIGRYGGEEFLMVLPNCTSREAAVGAEHLRARLAETPVLAVGRELRVTGSFGVTSYSATSAALNPLPKTDAATLIRHADDALYQAKSAGRDRVIISQF